MSDDAFDPGRAYANEAFTKRACGTCRREYIEGEGLPPHACVMRLTLVAFVGTEGMCFEVDRELDGDPVADLSAMLDGIDAYVQHCRRAPEVSQEAALLLRGVHGVHEGARDDRIRAAWRERGLRAWRETRIEVFRPGVESVYIDARLTGGGRWPEAWGNTASYTRDDLEAIRNELSGRASSMSPEEQIGYCGIAARANRLEAVIE